jgi:hypothetical protein
MDYGQACRQTFIYRITEGLLVIRLRSANTMQHTVRLARSVGLVKGEWIAIDGSKFQAVSSAKSVREREALERYLEQLEQSDEQDEVVIDPSAVASALEKLRQHPSRKLVSCAPLTA